MNESQVIRIMSFKDSTKERERERDTKLTYAIIVICSLKGVMVKDFFFKNVNKIKRIVNNVIKRI